MWEGASSGSGMRDLWIGHTRNAMSVHMAKNTCHKPWSLSLLVLLLVGWGSQLSLAEFCIGCSVFQNTSLCSVKVLHEFARKLRHCCLLQRAIGTHVMSLLHLVCEVPSDVCLERKKHAETRSLSALTTMVASAGSGPWNSIFRTAKQSSPCSWMHRASTLRVLSFRLIQHDLELRSSGTEVLQKQPKHEEPLNRSDSRRPIS